MKNNILYNKEKFYVFFIFIFAIIVNQYYGNKGVFPVDSFSHFDSGFRILLGEFPFKDYWIVSGPIIDYFQSIFFYFLGVNWQAYVFHASFINAILSVSTFLIFRNFNLNINYSLIYSLFFSILAYPVSGTPFVDHHSTFFSLLGVYSLILGIKNEKKINWILLPIFFSFAFLSKQVPSMYVIVSAILILAFFSIFKKKYYWIKYSSISLALLILLLLFFGKVSEISLSSFIEQYILYPQTIGVQRIKDINLSGIFIHFKFIFFALAPLLFINLKKLIIEKDYFRKNDFYYFLILVLFVSSLIFHQILTKNQIFIFFLIPILFAFSHIYLKPAENNFNIISLILVSICLFATIKYHIRFNENRKFHELNNVNFELSLNGSRIDKKLSGLQWITPGYKNNPKKEIILINKIKSHLLSDGRNKILITNYSFFSTILGKSSFSPSRWYHQDGTDFPMENNKYFTKYKDLLINIIENNDIDVIYTIYPQESSIIYTYIDQNCFAEKRISEMLNSYELRDCDEINN